MPAPVPIIDSFVSKIGFVRVKLMDILLGFLFFIEHVGIS